jgi:hypothetical protein
MRASGATRSGVTPPPVYGLGARKLIEMPAGVADARDARPEPIEPLASSAR